MSCEYKELSNLKEPFSLLPKELINYQREYIKLKDYPYPKYIREILYRLNSIYDLFSIKAFAQRRYFSYNLLSNLKLFIIQTITAIVGGFSCNDYFAYNVNKSTSLGKLLSSYIGYFRRWEYREHVNDSIESYFLWNKILTNLALKVNNLPTTNLKAIFYKNKSYYVTNFSVKEDNPFVAGNFANGKYIYKPACRRWGQDVGTFEINPIKRTNTLNGVTQIPSDIYKHLLCISENEPFIVEDRVFNHPDIAILSENSLNTVRIMTIRTKTNVIEPFAAAIRFSTTNNIIDNWSSGGLAAPVDLCNGRIGYPLAKHEMSNTKQKTLNSKINIDLKFLPFWDKILSLSILAHKVFSKMFSVGWDIAITSDGPMVIEGNDDWDIVLPQRTQRKGLWHTPFKKIIEIKRRS